MRESRRLPSSAEYFKNISESNALNKQGAQDGIINRMQQLPDKMKNLNYDLSKERLVKHRFDYNLYKPSAVKTSSKNGGTISQQPRITIFEHALVGRASPNILGVKSYSSLDLIRKYNNRKENKKVPENIQNDDPFDMIIIKSWEYKARLVQYPNIDSLYNKGKGGAWNKTKKPLNFTEERAKSQKDHPGPNRYKISTNAFGKKVELPLLVQKRK